MDQTSALPSGANRPQRRKIGRRELRTNLYFHFFTGPWLLGFLFLSVIPLALGLGLSFTNYDGYNWGAFRFVGLRNYIKAATHRDVIFALKNNAKYSLVAVPVGLTISFLLAVMLNQPLKARGLFRTLYYIPSVLPVTGAIWAWRLLVNKNTGLFNWFLSVIVPGTAINWVNEHWLGVMYMYNWWHAGGAMVLFLAGLQGIPQELYEAAHLDGANRLQAFWRVTVPLITPVLFFQLIMGMIGSLQIMDVPILLAGSGAMGATAGIGRERYFYMVYLYSQVFEYQRFGYGVALAWMFFLLVLVLTVLVMRSARYWVYYEVGQEAESA